MPKPIRTYSIYLLFTFPYGDGLAFSHIQIAWGRSIDTAVPDWIVTLKEWNDFSFLFSEVPKSRYAHAYFNLFVVLGLTLTVYASTQKRIVESTVACFSFFVALLAGVMSLPRFWLGHRFLLLRFTIWSFAMFPKTYKHF